MNTATKARRATSTVLQKIVNNNNNDKEDEIDEPELHALVEFITKDAVLWEVFQIKVREKQIVTTYATEEFLHNCIHRNKESFIMMHNTKKSMEGINKKQNKNRSMPFFQNMMQNNNSTNIDSANNDNFNNVSSNNNSNQRRWSFRKIDSNNQSNRTNNASMRRRSFKDLF